MGNIDCTTSSPALESNPDISGIGILIGFAVTAYSTLLLCFAHFMVDYEHLLNPFDQYFVDKIYHLFGLSTPSETSKKWTKALQAAVLTFSDQQVITGIAILISGYSQLRGGLAIYYWQLTVDLAWFSSVTHLTTLTCLRYYFQQRQGLRILRLICMAVTAGMLSCALASTGYLGGDRFNDDGNYFDTTYPAWCLFHRKFLKTATGKDDSDADYTGYYNTVYVVLVLLFLFVSYCARITQLFPSGLDKLRKDGHAWLSTFARSRLLNYKNKALGNLFPNYWALVYTLTMAIYCISKAAADLYSSMLWEITWLAAALAWGSSRIIMERNLDFMYQDPSSPASEDDVWGFGQVVAVALLLVPLFCFYESIYESVIMDRKNSERLPTSAPANSRSSVAIFISPNSTATSSSPGSSSAEPWTDLYKCAWFRSLVWLIYWLSLVTASNVIFEIPVSDGASNLKSDIGLFFKFYLAWFSFDLAMLLLFTITSLSLCHAQDTSEFRWTWMAKMRAIWRPSKRTKLIQRVILIVSVLILTALSAFFGWGIMFGVIPFWLQ